MKKLILFMLILGLMLSTVQALKNKETVGPWIVEFNSSQSYETRFEYKEPEQSGYSVWTLYLIDEMGHEVGWLNFRSYSYPQKATKDFLDAILDQAITAFKVTSPIKTSTVINSTEGRMGKGYSSWFSRMWHGIAWPYRPVFDPFTNTNTTRHYIDFNSLQETADFEAIASSLNVTNATGMQ
jgi:hypothetical protein